MSDFTLHDLQCFDAVVRSGGFQPAAALLHRSHPAVFAAVAKLERQLQLTLLDRSGYRVRPTEAGLSFHRRAQSLLRDLEGLRIHATQLSMGEESEIHVAIGDMCPRPQALGMLGRFFAQYPATRLHLNFEAVGGPWERLFDDDADLILHWIDKSDSRVEWIDLCLSIAGRHLPGRTEDLVVARRRDRPQGPLSNRLWDHIQQQAPTLFRAPETHKRIKPVKPRRRSK